MIAAHTSPWQLAVRNITELADLSIPAKARRIPHRTIAGKEHKFASCCNQWKPVIEFVARTRSWDGLQSTCRACDSQKRATNHRIHRNVKLSPSDTEQKVGA